MRLTLRSALVTAGVVLTLGAPALALAEFPPLLVDFQPATGIAGIYREMFVGEEIEMTVTGFEEGGRLIVVASGVVTLGELDPNTVVVVDDVLVPPGASYGRAFEAPPELADVVLSIQAFGIGDSGGVVTSSVVSAIFRDPHAGEDPDRDRD